SRMNVPEMPDYFPEGHLLEAHDELVQPELAQTLKLIQENGSNAFYKDEIANDIVEHIDEIEHSDLANYDIEITEPVHGDFAGYDIYSAPPPLAGVTLIQMLQMAEASQIDSMDNIVDYMHLSGEITKRTYNNRLDNIRDPKNEFSLYENTYKTTSRECAENFIGNCNEDKVSDYDINASLCDEEGHDNSTEFGSIDGHEIMVSASHALGNFFGSRAFVSGFFLH